MILLFIVCSCCGLLLAAGYAFIISKYISAWQALPEWYVPENFQPKTRATVIVPARNEEANILHCLQSLVAQNFPKELFEVIVVDDHSTDGTAQVVQSFSLKNGNVQLLSLADFVKKGETQSFKKKAIESAISRASGELILTTDADCEVPPNWLRLMVSFFEKKECVFIAAPVNFFKEKSTLEKFQSLDFIGMMGVTGAGIQLGWMNMCNGANLAYSKSAFKEIGGFSGIDHLASGDDILLMQKMASHFPKGIGFLKNREATVHTLAKPDLKSFFSQRLRWATKSANYQEWSVTFILAIVLFFCLAILGAFILSIFLGWKWLGLFASLFMIKSLADYFFLGTMSRYFGRSDLRSSFFSSQILHILYIVTVGVLSNLKKQYEWKGRKVK